MKIEDIKNKYIAIYPSMMGVVVRYGITNEFFQDHFIKHYKLDVNDFKTKMIMDWALSGNDPISREETDDIFINAFDLLNPTERLVYNMCCIDNYKEDEISKILKKEKTYINNAYNKAQNKFKNNEKITSYLNCSIHSNSELKMSI